ncbi:CdaR family transcriptional regulator [Mycobacterium sp. NAZ190054]|uniref:PucR family transcriptional regulator n=1 Tax=Mycobacterium sp. NAZ190054 TaxID=1747766 RepID=UPI000A8E52C8|nr:helix-turn-helix domain-containing protein [Mycobacterium sp. NAZ190054]
MSSSERGDEVIAQMARDLNECLEKLSQHSAEWVAEHELTYRQLVPLEATLRDSALCMRLVLGEVGQLPLEQDVIAHPERVGARSARARVPLEAVLRVLRADYRFLWEAMLDWSEAQGREEFEYLLMVGAGRVWDVIDSVSVRVAEAYRANDGSAQATFRGRELAFVEAVLRTGPLVRHTYDLAAQLGFYAPGQYVLATMGPIHRPDFNAERLQAQLAARGLRSIWVRTHEETVGVIALRTKSFAETQELIAQAADFPIGLGRVVTDIAELGDTRWLAQAALATLGSAGGPRLAAFDDHKVDAVISSAPDLCGVVADDLLRPMLNARGRDDFERLLQTIEVHLQGSGSPAETATKLHLHRNTVINRIRQFEELTGRSLRLPRDIVEVYVALRSWKLAHHKEENR